MKDSSRGAETHSAGWTSYPSTGEVNPQTDWQEIPESELYDEYEQYDWKPFGKPRKVKQLNNDKRYRLREQTQQDINNNFSQNQTPRRVKKQLVRGKEKKRWNGILGIFGI